MELLEIGKIVKSHGLKGRVKVASYLDMEEALQTIKVGGKSGKNY
ncbi:MAG: hypothetical protein QMD03_01135 [Syntrophales bacterium]|nr:hypothetical protein [Syntrophales bacterium]